MSQGKEIPAGLYDHRRRRRPLPSINFPVGFLGLLTLLLVYLKVTGHFQESWFWVFLPMTWLPILGLVFIVVFIVVFVVAAVFVLLIVLLFYTQTEIRAAWRRVIRDRN